MIALNVISKLIAIFGNVTKMFKGINYSWRIIATGSCFVLFGFGGLVLSLIVFPLQKIVIKDEIKQKLIARKTVHHTFKFFIAMMSFTGIFNFSLSKAQQLREINGYLILANHPSLIDVVVLISLIPNADCVVKTHLFNNVFLRGVVKNTGYISNSDSQGLLIDCQSSLAAGNNLIIFPQGTRTNQGEQIKFQRGAANIALRCQTKVMSVLLSVTPSTLTKSEAWFNVPATKAYFSAEVVNDTPIAPPIENDSISSQVRHYNRALEQFFEKELSRHE